MGPSSPKGGQMSWAHSTQGLEGTRITPAQTPIWVVTCQLILRFASFCLTFASGVSYC